MIDNLDKLKNKNNNTDQKTVVLTITLIIFVIWLCLPPYDKFAQVSLCYNNLFYNFSKLTNNSAKLPEWKFYRNNAVYLARMNKKSAALRSIDKAIQTVPSNVPKNTVDSLYYDRAQVRLYFGDKKGALNDYLRNPTQNILDLIKIAMLYKSIGKNRYALSYCNNIINMNSNAYLGYACTADVYAAAGRYDIAIKVYDYLIDKSPNNSRYYSERAEYKQLSGDIDGYEKDVAEAKSLSPIPTKNFSIIREAENPTSIKLSYMS